jgi:hypothetical protein
MSNLVMDYSMHINTNTQSYIYNVINDLYTSGKLTLIKDNYNLISCFFHKNTTITLGRNKPTYTYCNIPISIHAEIDILNKLKSKFIQTKKIQKGDLLILRVLKDGCLSIGCPCFHCIKQLEKAYYIKIRNIFYSDRMGIIKHINFNKLWN